MFEKKQKRSASRKMCFNCLTVLISSSFQQRVSEEFSWSRNITGPARYQRKRVRATILKKVREISEMLFRTFRSFSLPEKTVAYKRFRCLTIFWEKLDQITKTVETHFSRRAVSGMIFTLFLVSCEQYMFFGCFAFFRSGCDCCYTVIRYFSSAVRCL